MAQVKQFKERVRQLFDSAATQSQQMSEPEQIRGLANQIQEIASQLTNDFTRDERVLSCYEMLASEIRLLRQSFKSVQS